MTDKPNLAHVHLVVSVGLDTAEKVLATAGDLLGAISSGCPTAGIR